MTEELHGQAEDRAEAVAQLLDLDLAAVAIAEADGIGGHGGQLGAVGQEVWLAEEGEDLGQEVPFLGALRLLDGAVVEVLEPAHIAVYGQRATGTKYLINPSKS